MAATETLTPGFLHCPEPRCPGSAQVPAGLVQTLVTETFAERGGATGDPRDALPENSHEYLRVSDAAELECPHCARTRECSLVERPRYDPLSGKDPMGLLGAKPFDPAMQFGPEDERLKDMQDEMAAMRDEMAKLRAGNDAA